MLNRGFFCKIIFVILIATAIIFSGCSDPNPYSGNSGVGQATQTRANDTQSDIEAVKLYVDAMQYVDEMMLKEIQEWDEAIQKLNNAIAYAPDFSLAYSSMGDIYQLSEQYEVSANSYEEATKIDPWSFKDFSNLGKVSQILEDFSRAVKAYVSACELEPDDFDVNLGAGRCYYELEDYDLAFGYGQRAKEIDPNTGNVDVLLGDIYVEKSDLTEAVASYKRALEIDGNKPETMVALAVAYTKQERYDFAEELLVLSIEKDANSSTAFQYLGFVQLYLHKDDLNLALGSYETAVQIDKKDWMARKGLGVVYMLKYYKLRAEAAKQKTLDELDHTFKQKSLEHWDVSLAIKPDQPELKNLYQQCNDL
jgi:tetratricopeptide (TPR) repeat protein